MEGSSAQAPLRANLMANNIEEHKKASPPRKRPASNTKAEQRNKGGSPASSTGSVGVLSPPTSPPSRPMSPNTGPQGKVHRPLPRSSPAAGVPSIAPEALVGRWIEVTGDGALPTGASVAGLTTKTRGVCKVLNFERAYNPTASSKINSLHTVDFRLSSDEAAGVEQVLLFRKKKVISWNGGKTFTICSDATAAEYDECEAMGFSMKSAYDKCKALGFVSKAEYERALSLGLADKAELDDFTRMGFDDVGEFIECKEAGCKSKKEYDAWRRSDLEESREADVSTGTYSAAPAPWRPANSRQNSRDPARLARDPAGIVGKWVHVTVSRIGGRRMVGKILAFHPKPWWEVLDLDKGSMHTVDFSVSGGGVDLVLLERLKLCQHNNGDQYTLCSDEAARDFDEVYARGGIAPGFERRAAAQGATSLAAAAAMVEDAEEGSFFGSDSANPH